MHLMRAAEATRRPRSCRRAETRPLLLLRRDGGAHTYEVIVMTHVTRRDCSSRRLLRVPGGVAAGGPVWRCRPWAHASLTCGTCPQRPLPPALFGVTVPFFPFAPVPSRSCAPRAGLLTSPRPLPGCGSSPMLFLPSGREPPSPVSFWKRPRRRASASASGGLSPARAATCSEPTFPSSRHWGASGSSFTRGVGPTQTLEGSEGHSHPVPSDCLVTMAIRPHVPPEPVWGLHAVPSANTRPAGAERGTHRP